MRCNIDWLLTFKGFETFLTPLATAAWPIGLFGVAWLLRSEIRGILPRIRSIRGAGLEADLAEGQSQENASPAPLPIAGFGAGMPPSDVVYNDFDQVLRSTLDNEFGADTEKKLAWAIRLRSLSEVGRLHEWNFRNMFGSQLRALRALNSTTQMKASDLEQYLKEAQANPDTMPIHQSRTFDEWVRYLIQTGYILESVEQEARTFEITNFGHNFLQWVTEARVWDFRPG
jgi:hypothetical protein